MRSPNCLENLEQAERLDKDPSNLGVHINDSGFVVGGYHQSHVSRLQAQTGINPVSRIFAIVISHRVEENQKERRVQLLVAPYTISVQNPQIC